MIDLTEFFKDYEPGQANGELPEVKRFEELDSDEFKRLYFAFVSYRDKECGGHAKMTVQAFYRARPESVLPVMEVEGE